MMKKKSESLSMIPEIVSEGVTAELAMVAGVSEVLSRGSSATRLTMTGGVEWHQSPVKWLWISNLLGP